MTTKSLVGIWRPKLTAVRAAFQLDPHAHSPLVAAEGHDPDPAGEGGRVQRVLDDGVRVGVGGENRGARRGDVADVMIETCGGRKWGNFCLSSICSVGKQGRKKRRTSWGG